MAARARLARVRPRPPDLYIVAGVPRGKLDAAVDELLGLLAEPPVPRPSTARVLATGAAAGVAAGAAAVVAAGTYVLSSPRYALETLRYYTAPAKRCQDDQDESCNVPATPSTQSVVSTGDAGRVS